MTGYRYARRAEVLGDSVHDHTPGAIALGSGLAYPPLLPDVVREAMEAARDRPAETLQYGPLMGLDDLRDAMVDAFGEFLPEARIRIPQGGYFLWAALPEGADAEAVAGLALKHGAEVGSGRLCFPNDVPGHHVRLAYSFVGVEEIREGVCRLGDACREYAARA